MFKIPIFKAEAEAGLTEIIQANASIAYCCPVTKAEVNKSNLSKYLSEGSKKFDLDILYPTKSVLVTSNWNRNDDVFGVEEIWAARTTPVHKPTNINHDHNQIVGHITDTWVIDAEGNIIDDDTVVDDLPSQIHICNGAVIYKHYKEENLTDRALELIEQIEANEKFVSMECLFPNFDYALVSPDNENYTIARNEETAFLTKHLRIYGGEGSFNGYKVGRYLKNMVFSGKGYVDKPANPDSIIFSEDKPDFNFSDATHKSTFNFKNGVDNIMSETPQVSAANCKNSKEKQMSDNNDFYKEELAKTRAEVAELVKTNKELQESLASANVEQLKSQVEDLTTQLKVEAEAKEAITVQLTETKSSIETLETTLKETTESKEKLEAAVEKAKADKIFSDRVTSLVEAGVDRERAEEAAEKFSNLTDEQFDEAKSLFGEMKRDAEADRDADDRMSETDEVLSNKGDKDATANEMERGRHDKKKAKKGEAPGTGGKIPTKAELDDALETAEVDASDDDLGATEADDADEAETVRTAMSSYFADSLGLTKESNE